MSYFLGRKIYYVGSGGDTSEITDAISTIIKDLDGYALDSTVSENWSELNTQTQNLRDACDGYGAPDTTTIDLHWSELNSQTQSLRDVLDDSDGYLSCDGSRPLTGTLKFGGATADYPALKAVGNGLHARLASDDGYCLLSAGNLEINGQAWNTLPTTLAPSGSTQTVDWDDGLTQILDLSNATGPLTLTFSNPKAAASYILVIIQHATVPVDIVWPVNVMWPDAISPVISTGAGAIDSASLLFYGSFYLANIGQNYGVPA